MQLSSPPTGISSTVIQTATYVTQNQQNIEMVRYLLGSKILIKYKKNHKFIV